MADGGGTVNPDMFARMRQGWKPSEESADKTETEPAEKEGKMQGRLSTEVTGSNIPKEAAPHLATDHPRSSTVPGENSPPLAHSVSPHPPSTETKEGITDVMSQKGQENLYASKKTGEDRRRSGNWGAGQSADLRRSMGAVEGAKARDALQQAEGEKPLHASVRPRSGTVDKARRRLSGLFSPPKDAVSHDTLSPPIAKAEAKASEPPRLITREEAGKEEKKSVGLFKRIFGSSPKEDKSTASSKVEDKGKGHADEPKLSSADKKTLATLKENRGVAAFAEETLTQLMIRPQPLQMKSMGQDLLRHLHRPGVVTIRDQNGQDLLAAATRQRIQVPAGASEAQKTTLETADRFSKTLDIFMQQMHIPSRDQDEIRGIWRECSKEVMEPSRLAESLQTFWQELNHTNVKGEPLTGEPDPHKKKLAVMLFSLNQIHYSLASQTVNTALTQGTELAIQKTGKELVRVPILTQIADSHHIDLTFGRDGTFTAKYQVSQLSKDHIAVKSPPETPSPKDPEFKAKNAALETWKKENRTDLDNRQYAVQSYRFQITTHTTQKTHLASPDHWECEVSSEVRLAPNPDKKTLKVAQELQHGLSIAGFQPTIEIEKSPVTVIATGFALPRK